MDNVFFLILAILTGILFIGLGVPLALRKVSPNHWYGLRIPATLSNEKVWYEANEHCGKHFILIGIGIIIVAIILDVLVAAILTKVLFWSGLVLISTFHMVFHQWRHANRLENKLSYNKAKRDSDLK